MVMKGMLGKWLGKGQVECHFVGFPERESILGVLEVPSTPQKPKWAVNHQSNPETWKNCRKPMKTKLFPLIPTMLQSQNKPGNLKKK